MVGPSRPSSPISRKISISVFSLRNDISTRGISLSWLYAAAASRTMRSSAVSCWSSSRGSAQWNSALAAMQVSFGSAGEASGAGRMVACRTGASGNHDGFGDLRGGFLWFRIAELCSVELVYRNGFAVQQAKPPTPMPLCDERTTADLRGAALDQSVTFSRCRAGARQRSQLRHRPGARAGADALLPHRRGDARQPGLRAPHRLPQGHGEPAGRHAGAAGLPALRREPGQVRARCRRAGAGLCLPVGVRRGVAGAAAYAGVRPVIRGLGLAGQARAHGSDLPGIDPQRCGRDAGAGRGLAAVAGIEFYGARVPGRAAGGAARAGHG
ncbi:hypothetical protein D9M72_461180 [compost metagenome]